MSTVQLTKPAHVTSLATNSVLVSIDVNVWSATKQDKETSDEVTTAKKADRNAGRFTQHLLADNPVHKQVMNYRQTIYNWVQRRTYPWSGSHNILPVCDLPKFMEEFKFHEQEFNTLVDKFIAAYPNIISDMAFKMGSMFDRNNYPTPEQARNKFGITLYTSEVPQGDFRVSISQDLADDLQKNYQKQTDRLVDNILSKQADQFSEVMESLSKTCDIETVVDAKTGIVKVKRRKLYDSTIQRALELCDTFSSFNLTSNAKLEAARTSLQTLLLSTNAEQIREMDSKRVEVKNEVDSILKKFRGI